MGKEKKATTASRPIRVSVNAISNINEVVHYISIIKQQPLNAIKAGDAIFEMIDNIGQSPLAYKECEELPTKTKMYRRAVCYSWLIIYKITAVEIVILAVIHGSRRPSQIKKLKSIK